MKFLAFAGLFAGLGYAQTAGFDPVYKPTEGEKVSAGTTYTIEWTAPSAYKSITISIRLIGGENQDGQETLLEIASNVKNSDEKYNWAIPNDKKILGKKFYGLVLMSEADKSIFQYSSPFLVVGDGNETGSRNKTTTPEPTSQATSTTVITSRSTTTSSEDEEETTSEVKTVPQTTSAARQTAQTTTHFSTSLQTPSATSKTETPAQKTGTSAAAGQARPYFTVVALSVAAAFLLW